MAALNEEFRQGLLTALKGLLERAETARLARLTEVEASMRHIGTIERPELGVIPFTAVMERARRLYGAPTAAVQLVVMRPTATGTTDIHQTERIILTGRKLVEYYCQRGTLQGANPRDGTVTVETKRSLISSDLEREYPVRLRAAEETPGAANPPAWVNDRATYKIFRYRQRYSFTVPGDAPLRYDLSVYREGRGQSFQSAMTGSPPVPMLQSQERYDLEVDYTPTPALVAADFKDATRLQEIAKRLESGLMLFLQVYYQSPFYLRNSERTEVLEEYNRLVGAGASARQRFNFAGVDVVPGQLSSFVRQTVNAKGEKVATAGEADAAIAPANANLENYLFSFKADGARFLVFINRSGHCYLVDGGQKVVKTDWHFSTVDEQSLSGTLFDAEVVERVAAHEEGLYSPDHWRLMIFDVLYWQGESVRELPLTVPVTEDTPRRLLYIEGFVNTVVPGVLATVKGQPYYRIETKPYYSGTTLPLYLTRTIQELLRDYGRRDFPTDGFIMTDYRRPYPVRGTHASTATGAFTYKVKDRAQLTVDFLVRRGELQRRMDPSGQLGETRWWNFLLHVGDKGVPVPFTPFFDNGSQGLLLHPARLIVQNNEASNHSLVRCEEDRFVLYDGFVYECYYDSEAQHWRPLRHRPLKTTQNRPNAWATANNNWDLLLNLTDPLVRDYEFSESNLVKWFREYADNYLSKVEQDFATAFRKRYGQEYDPAKTTERATPLSFGGWFLSTASTRMPPHYYATGFEERYLHADKHELPELDPLKRVHRKVTGFLYQQAAHALAAQNRHALRLLELAVGQAGDIHKWQLEGNHIASVVGVDADRGQITSAWSRYRAGSRRGVGSQTSTEPYRFIADFIVGDMTKPLETGAAAPVGDTATARHLEGVFAAPGTFDLVMCQFALHYAARTQAGIEGLLQNVSRNLRPGGLFMGAAFDGRRVHAALQGAPNGRLEARNSKGDLWWSMERRYPASDPLLPFGQEVAVYVSGLNLLDQALPEALLNFDYWRETATRYGLIMTQVNGLAGGVGQVQPFAEVYRQWEAGRVLPPWGTVEQLRNDLTALTRHPLIRTFSEYNAVFVFQKTERLAPLITTLPSATRTDPVPKAATATATTATVATTATATTVAEPTVASPNPTVNKLIPRVKPAVAATKKTFTARPK